MAKELLDKTAHELHDLLVKKEISCRELTEEQLKQIEQKDGQIKAYLKVTADLARQMAQAVDDRIGRGETIGPLAGIPLAIKDNMCLKGQPTTCASKILENFQAPYDATVVEKLRQAGCVFLGKTNLDEFAMGSSTENSAFGPTRNPWDTSRVPGGSSGGSAAAVAAREAVLATGSDTGGSIRQPAAFCGVVGLKPTYGRVSRYGLVAFASSLDQIGTFSRDVTDCANYLQAISGPDAKDSTSVPLPVPDYAKSLVKDIKGLKVGIIKDLLGDGIDEKVKAKIREAAQRLEKLGAVIGETSLPSFDYALATYYLVAPAEASANLARYDGVKYGLRVPEADLISMYTKTRQAGFGAEVKRRIMLGTYALSAGYYDAYYLKALKVRTLIRQDFAKSFEKFDILISPTAPTTAFKIGEKAADPLQMYLSDIATIPVNLAGLPAISLPCGLSEGLPVGLQIIAPPFKEELLLRTAYAYEQA